MYMRKVELRMNEEFKYEVIKSLYDHKGNKKAAALKLGCTVRTVNRLLNIYVELGKDAFIHGNRGKKPVTTISDDQRQLIIDLYNTKYLGSNFQHYTELLEKHEGMSISTFTVRSILYEANILSPKVWRRTKKKKKNELTERLQSSSSKRAKETALKEIESLDRYSAHPRRPRSAYEGELIQMDASPHVWFGDEVTHLHLAIDDATGKIVGSYFDHQETLNAYYHVCRQIITDYGIPHKFLTDRRTVFEYKKKNCTGDEQDTFTQFSYACHTLGIELEATSVPQAKGRVERLNQTLQSRLVTEMRLSGVQNIEEANQFMSQFTAEFNERFSLPINSTKNVYEKQLENQDLNLILAVLSNRKIDTGHCIRYQNKYYLPETSRHEAKYFNKGTPALVVQSMDGALYVNINESMFLMREVEERLDKSEVFDDVVKVKEKKKYIPPLNHPWRSGKFKSFVETQKHRSEVGANV